MKPQLRKLERVRTFMNALFVVLLAALLLNAYILFDDPSAISGLAFGVVSICIWQNRKDVGRCNEAIAELKIAMRPWFDEEEEES